MYRYIFESHRIMHSKRKKLKTKMAKSQGEENTVCHISLLLNMEYDC